MLPSPDWNPAPQPQIPQPEPVPSLLELQGRDAEVVWRLAHGLDIQLEASQQIDATVEGTLQRVGPWILRAIGANGLGLWLADPYPSKPTPSLDPLEPDTATDPRANFFQVGDDRLALAQLIQERSQEPLQERSQEPLADRPNRPRADRHLMAIPLVVHDETIGLLAASFTELPPSPGPEVLLEVVGQELNNLFYEFRRARILHHQLLNVGRLLQHRVLETALDGAIAYLLKHTPITALVIAYYEDPADSAHLCLRTYRRDQPPQHHRQGDPSLLGQLFHHSPRPSVQQILTTAAIEGYGIGPSPIDAGLRDRTDHGLIGGAIATAADVTAIQELLEQVANALGQRLVDYHKDRRYLQAFFAPQHVSQLLSLGNYQQACLDPQLQDIAMLYTDINSFTKISEQILDTPQEVGEFVDYWAEGVVQILYQHQGVFDKMVGDCVIGLFGPPFNDGSAVDKVAAAVRTALAVTTYTQQLMGPAVVEKIRRSPLIPGLGVATGVNYGSVMVGTFGPNRDFTAFGREMNNTARLQGVAGFGETLVMESAHGLLVAADHGVLREAVWGDRATAQVKNVQEPLLYRSVRSP